MISKFVLGVCSPNPLCATSYYRAWGPLLHMQRTSLNLPADTLELADLSESVDWRKLSHLDAILFQRPFGKQSIAQVEAALGLGVPVWMDWDDNYFDVPKDNPAYSQYEHDRQSLVTLARHAHAVSVSTENLKTVLQTATGVEAVVIPNAIDLAWYGSIRLQESRRQNPDGKTRVLWRGSASSIENLRYYSKAIIEAAYVYPDVQWIFQGTEPHFLIKDIPLGQARHIPWSTVPQCFLQTVAVEPDILMVPTTADSAFNKCRSNTGWMEGVAAGAVVVAPDWRHWRKPGTFSYIPGPPDTSSFESALMLAIESSAEKRSCMVEEAREVLAACYCLADVNRQRAELLTELSKRPTCIRVSTLKG